MWRVEKIRVRALEMIMIEGRKLVHVDVDIVPVVRRRVSVLFVNSVGIGGRCSQERSNKTKESQDRDFMQHEAPETSPKSIIECSRLRQRQLQVRSQHALSTKLMKINALHLYQDENYRSSGRVLVLEANLCEDICRCLIQVQNNSVAARVPDSGVVKSNREDAAKILLRLLLRESASRFSEE